MNGPTGSGDELVAAAIGGDRRAISTLWQRHRRWIAAVLLAYKPPEADLEDLLQEVAMRMVRRIDTLREASNVRAWLRSVAINVARSAARRRPLPPLDARACDDAVADTRAAVDVDRSSWLADRLRQLPEHYREPLMLRAVHGLRSKQIGAILDLPAATIDTRIARARRMLRDLAPDGGTPEAVAKAEHRRPSWSPDESEVRHESATSG